MKAMLISSVLLCVFFNNTVFYIGNREKHQVHGRYKPRELKQKQIPGFQPSRQFQVSHFSCSSIIELGNPLQKQDHNYTLSLKHCKSYFFMFPLQNIWLVAVIFCALIVLGYVCYSFSVIDYLVSLFKM